MKVDEKLVKRINDAAVAIRAGLHVSGSVLRKLVVALDESSALEDARRWRHVANKRSVAWADDIDAAIAEGEG